MNTYFSRGGLLEAPVFPAVSGEQFLKLAGAVALGVWLFRAAFKR